MKKLRFRQFLLILAVFYSFNSYAQVKGLSYTLSPTAEYNWFNEKSGLENGYLGGGQLGFGFGEFVELRANYQQGFGLKTDIQRFGLANADELASKYTSRDVDMTRYGGELKLNLSRTALLPYLTLGTGIQELEAENLDKLKQIFLTTGLGVKFSAANRYTIGLQALRTGYRSNGLTALMSSTERDALGLEDQSLENENLTNYAVRASLVFYLGGRKPGTYTDVDNAYFDNFSGGFRGLSIPIEPTVMKIDFHDDLAFRDAWFAGGSAGINIGPLIGLRGFYWRAIEEDKTTDFEDLALYGGEARFKLNEGKGFTPWVTVGGGVIDAGDDYKPKNDIRVEDKAFAMGGLGLDLPFSKYIKATGFVRSILTTTQSADNVAMPEDLKNSWSYGASLNFVLGRKPKNVDTAKQDAMDAYLLSTQREYDLATEQLKAEYDEKITKLEKQLEAAVKNQDVDAVKAISKQKEITEQVRSTIGETKTAPNVGGQPVRIGRDGKSVIKMTPSEFQLLLRDILDAKAGKALPAGQPMGEAPSQGANPIDAAINNLKMEQQIADLTRALDDLKDDKKSMESVIERLKEKDSEIADDLEDLVDSYNDKVRTLQRETADYKSRVDHLYNTQAKIEAGLMSKDTNNLIMIESVNYRRFEGDIAATNRRIDDLGDVMIESLEEIKEGAYWAEKDENLVSEKRAAGVSNESKVQVSDDLKNRKGYFSKLKYSGMSGFAGFGLGDNASFNLGYRLHYKIGDSKNLEFVPETYFGFGSPSSFGIMANATYALSFLTKSEIIKPYVGAGLGFMKVGDKFDADQLTGAYNFIVGTSLNIWNGNLYVDYTARNLFKYNQLIVGYRLPF